MRATRVVGLFLFILSICGAAVCADDFKIDPVHSTVGFAVKHMMVNTVHGRFTDYMGQISYDEKDPSKSSVHVVIRKASINTDNAQRDNDLKSANFLDVEKFPEITFPSDSLEKKGDDLVAHGTLTIHGIAKKVDLPFKLSGPITAGRAKLLGAEASLTINRQDYGISWSKSLDNGGLVVSNEVRIEINVEAKEAKPYASGAVQSSR